MGKDRSYVRKTGLVVIFVLILLVFISCSKDQDLPDDQDIGSEDIDEVIEDYSEDLAMAEILNKEGHTIGERYNPPQGYKRIEVANDSFENFLRNQKLKPYGEVALYYDGRTKNSIGSVYDSVIDVDIGDRDLHQCADAVMLLRAEYLYAQEQYDDIRFNFVSGFDAKYSKWRQGNRIQVDGNDVTFYNATDPDDSYESFRKYMDMVMAYAGTLSLEQELVSVDIDDMQIGDVFIKGGSPGHAIIVVDMAINDNGESVFMLAQSYMPAQQTQILINRNNPSISPWYSLKGETKLDTPEWSFELGNLKRFEQVGENHMNRDSKDDIPYEPVYVNNYKASGNEVYIEVTKSKRKLRLYKGDDLINEFNIGLGAQPVGHKEREGDSRTPVGEYYVCAKNPNSAFYLSLGLSYPNAKDAQKGFENGVITEVELEQINTAISRGGMPSWNTALGGEIMIHGHGGNRDWTAGCVAVDDEIMDILWEYCGEGTKVFIFE